MMHGAFTRAEAERNHPIDMHGFSSRGYPPALPRMQGFLRWRKKCSPPEVFCKWTLRERFFKNTLLVPFLAFALHLSGPMVFPSS